MNISNAIGMLVMLFLLLTPFFILSVFVTTCCDMPLKEQRALAVRITCAVIVITVILYLFGEMIFRYLGITLDAFRIGAGLVLMLNGIDMVRSSGLPKNRDIGTGNGDPAVVPLAIPTTVGPGTIGTMLVMGAQARGVVQRLVEIVAIVLAGVLVGVVLYNAQFLEKVLKNKGLSILSKLTGMYIVALAAQIIFTGVNGMLGNTLVQLLKAGGAQ